MEEKVKNIIPTIMGEMESDLENESKALLCYYNRCSVRERTIIDHLFLYLCGWTFPTILEKCGLKTSRDGIVGC
jgi:hypothetical protein